MPIWPNRDPRKRILAEYAAVPRHWQELFASRPLLAHRPSASRTRLQQLATGLLAEKQFIGGGDHQPHPGDCMLVALLAAVPILELDPGWYRGFSTFILYPDEFLADYEELDEAGVLHVGRDRRAGEAWLHGPIVLSMTDVAASGLGEGYNVVVHELAHQLDHINGEASGFPPLHRDMDSADWTAAFSAGFERLQAELEADQQPWLDPYGSEHPAEFFAVCCELFFDVPDYLSQADPAIYRQLATFFRQDPAHRPSGSALNQNSSPLVPTGDSDG